MIGKEKKQLVFIGSDHAGFQAKGMINGASDWGGLCCDRLRVFF